MRIQDANGKPLKTLDDWQAIHKPKHWKRGRSAYEVADFIVNRSGADKLARRVSLVLGDTVQFEQITPEFEVRFDKYGKGRFHDIGIVGETAHGERLFIGVEAKVDESFGLTVAEEWQKGQRTVAGGKRTHLPDRIRELCSRFQDGPGIRETDQIRYQLMHGTAGTVSACAECSVFYVAVFVTDAYNHAKGEANYNDYLAFVRQVGGGVMPNGGDGATSHALRVAGKRLITIYEYFDGRE